jgi:tetratricopeptide (TPR) repeat protein
VAGQSSLAWLAFLIVIGISAVITWVTWNYVAPNDPLATARHQIENRQYDKAVPLLDAIIAADGDSSAEAYMLRGTCYLELHDPSRAEADLSESIRRRDNDFRSYSRRAKARMNAGNLDSAIDDYTKALEIKPGADDLHSRGLARAKREQNTQAIDDFTAALKLAPDNTAEIYEARAFVADKAGQPATFERDLLAHQVLTAHAESRTEAEWQTKLATIHGVDAKETTTIITRTTKVVETVCQETQYQQPAHLDLLAMLHASQGNFEQAVKHASTAVELAPAADKAKYAARLKLYQQGKAYTRG